MSHRRQGHTISPEQLSRIMLALQLDGCHNLNLVTCTHFLPGVLEAVNLAVSRGLVLPIVYNTSGYESLEVLKLLDGIVDIYLPDMKYNQEKVAEQYSSVPDYPRINREAVGEMHRQVGNLSVNAQGVALRGVLIRHLVLPHDLAGTQGIMRFIAREISPQACVSLMSQYLPLWSAREDPLLGRGISEAEYLSALNSLEKAGLSRGWVQETVERSSEKTN
jgi:putative pyruvate formate lyase activating enzyme